MAWIVAALVVVVAGLAWLAAQGRLGGMPPLVDDRPGLDLPDAALEGDDLRGVRFAVVARGYSMEQVDALLDRLANQLEGLPYGPADELDTWANDGAPAGAIEPPMIDDGADEASVGDANDESVDDASGADTAASATPATPGK